MDLIHRQVLGKQSIPIGQDADGSDEEAWGWIMNYPDYCLLSY